MFQGEFMMTGSGPAVVNQSVLASPPSELEEIDSRFGRVTVNPHQSIVFPTGMLGMPDKMQFCLTHFPSDKMARFKLLQSIEDHALSFITLPVDVMNPIIDRADLEMAARDLEVSLDDIAVLLITTVQREGGAVQLTVNARAPIFMHLSRRVAAQYVFPNTKYQIRQPLAM
jgi:flagellar assembly factor FliW